MKQDAFARLRRHNTRRAAPGFSLIEMLIGSVVFVVVLLAILMILDISQRDYASGAAKSDVQENVRVVLESMARELRMAGYSPSKADCLTPPGDAVTGLNPLTFYADVDGDYCVDKVTYTFTAPVVATRACDPSDPDTIGKITRSVQTWNGAAWNPSDETVTAYDVAQCVKTVTIIYYNSGVGETTVPTEVRRIKISITGEDNVRGHAPRAYTVSTDVRLRNL